MFRIDYEIKGQLQQPIFSSDIKDVGQILINIANDEQAENEAMEWCGQANWGDNFVNQKYRFSIKCVYDEKHVLKPGTPGSKLNRSSNKFMDEEFLQKIANVISKKTGCSNNYAGCDNDSLTWDFDCGLSYMKNNNGNGMYFAIVSKYGKEIETILDTDVDRFIERVVKGLKNYIKLLKRIDRENSLTIKTTVKNGVKVKFATAVENRDIVAAIKNAVANKSEWHGRIYDDGCWWIDIERHPYGRIRFWVGFEDKRNGKCRASLISVYKASDTELGHRTDGIIVKKAVLNKLYSTVKALDKHRLIDIV